ncbi:hypothetical protein DL96DRAFT_1634635, partial [Flagelloscypha sp. PMI_526]
MVAIMLPDFDDREITVISEWADESYDGCPDSNEAILNSLLACTEQPSNNRSAIFPNNRITSLLSSVDNALEGTTERIRWCMERLKRIEECRDRLTLLRNTVKELGSREYLPIPNLPSDIMQGIFRAAVMGFPQDKTCSNLSLVSRQVQQWADPILFDTVYYENMPASGRVYGHITVRRIGPPDRLKSLAEFENSPRLKLARLWTRQLFIRDAETLVGEKDLKDILQKFPSLQVVYYDAGLPSWEFTLPSLHCFAWNIPEDDSNITFPLVFSTLTHLQLNFMLDISFSSFPWDLVKTLANLRVLAIEMLVDDFGDSAEESIVWIGNVQASLHATRAAPSLRLIMWSSYPWNEEADLDWTACAAAINDDRLIYCITEEYEDYDEIPTKQEVYEKGWPFLVTDDPRSSVWVTQFASEAFEVTKRRNILKGEREESDS